MSGGGEGMSLADADRLSQLIGNLVGNAVAYGDPAEPITVTSQIEARMFVLSVHNHGEPIPAASLRTLFEPMVRGDGSSADAKRSVGLGLFIVREIVRAHRGEILGHLDRRRRHELPGHVPQAGAHPAGLSSSHRKYFHPVRRVRPWKVCVPPFSHPMRTLLPGVLAAITLLSASIGTPAQTSQRRLPEPIPACWCVTRACRCGSNRSTCAPRSSATR
jgi:hypothetical protein